MSNERRNFTVIEENILYNEVDGCCPLCQKKLHYYKDGKENKLYEKAHIYPLNPMQQEVELLKNEPILFDDDPNDLKNLIALCPNCHTTLDKPTTIASYRKLYNIKKNILKNREIIDIYSDYTIEEEIINIISRMNVSLASEQEQIKYDLLKIEEKINKENHILINKVRSDVTSYYIIIKKLFAEMDRTSLGFFNNIAGQIKAFSIKLSSITDNQDQIYEHIAQWLFGKIKYGSIESYRIIVSFFIQNCEVFSNVS